MKTVWNHVNHYNMSVNKKNSIFILLLMLIFAAAGGIFWGFPGRLFLPGTEYFICFMGYPAVFIGLFGGFFYLYNHDFS